MGVPICLVEIHGQTESFEVSSNAGDNPFGQSPSSDLIECRVEKRKSSDTPIGVFELQLVRSKDSQGRTWRDKIRPQDVVVIQMMNYQGKSGEHGAGELHTVMIGFVTSITVGTTMTGRGPQRVIYVRGMDFGKIFTSGMVTYWTFLGASLIGENVGSAYNFLDANKLNGKPDQTVSILINDLFSRFMDIRFTVEQSPHSIFEMLAQQLESYGAEFPAAIDLNFLNGQGSFWSFFTKLCSPPFHEMWIDTRRSGDLSTLTDSSASTVLTPSLTLGKDNSCPVIIMRPTPFPYLKSDGRPTSTRWDNLTRHYVGSDDLSGEPYDEMLTVSDEEHFNFYLIDAKSPWLGDKSYLMTVRGIIDRARFKRYGYKPMTPPTSLLQAPDLDSEQDPLGIFYTAMNWRLASWNVLNDWFESGYKSFKLMPHIHVGERLVDESDWQETAKEFYVESIIHHYTYSQKATTTVGLTRGLTVTEYANIGQHLLGQRLELIEPSKVVDTYKQLLDDKA